MRIAFALIVMHLALAGCAEPAMPAVSPDEFLAEVNKDRKRPVGLRGVLQMGEAGYYLQGAESRIGMRDYNSECLSRLSGESVIVLMSPQESFSRETGHIESFIMVMRVDTEGHDPSTRLCAGEAEHP